MAQKDTDSFAAFGLRNKTNRPRAIRRLVIWYRRNAAVTTIVDKAANSASAAGNVAGTMGSSAGSVVTGAGSMAGSVLQPFVFDPLRRLQGGDNNAEKIDIDDSEDLALAKKLFLGQQAIKNEKKCQL